MAKVGGKRPGARRAELSPEQILKDAEDTLRAPLADWDAVYFRVRSSAIGGDFTPERFLRTPISTIRWLLRQIDDHDCARANTHSVTTARLTGVLIQVAHGFSGSKRPAPKIQPREFLPFPDWKPEAATADGPDAPTKFILSELVRTRQVPLHVYAALAASASDSA